MSTSYPTNQPFISNQQNTSYPIFNNTPPPPYDGQVTPNQQYTNPMSKIELIISCRNLIDLDVFSKSDPFVVVYMETKNKEWREIGRTEVIQDCLNPDFVTSFLVDYFFEEQQNLKFEVYDSDTNSRNLADQDYIGKMVTSLGSIVGENCGRLEHSLQIPTIKDKERNDKFARRSPGTIIIRAEEVNSNRDVVTLHLCGKGLDKKDFFGKSDPFLVFARCSEDNSYSTVHKTEMIKNTLNPTWKPFSVPVQTLCNGDLERNLKVSCYDWNSNGSHEIIGSFSCVLKDLINFKNGSPSFYEVINDRKKAKKKGYKHSGTIHIIDCTIFQKATFLEYVRGGVELNFVVAIDFTASNGQPSFPQSLHYNGPNQPSQYVQVLQAIGGIIEDYDTDKLFPAFGFGAKLPPSFNVSHNFAMNFNPQNPYCQGVNGVLAAYYNSISNVQLYGPTNFSPIINNTASLARDAGRISPGSQYFVLLIITDGIISDMERTKSAIVEASKLPMSIIIVGVGDAEFDAMEELDGDVNRLSYMGTYAERDIVQFVPFRDFLQGSVYNPASGERLARDVLRELPDQLVGYMEKKHIKPNLRPPPPPYS